MHEIHLKTAPKFYALRPA